MQERSTPRDLWEVFDILRPTAYQPFSWTPFTEYTAEDQRRDHRDDDLLLFLVRQSNEIVELEGSDGVYVAASTWYASSWRESRWTCS